MSCTYEVFVDMQKCQERPIYHCDVWSTRYEIEAESRNVADHIARDRAGHDYPKASEYDIRVTRILH